ncbi:hypothetical protein C8R46DRAFT_1217835 [Mycena filopes]|nr:hypothetical protein C8R46DRAFT_1217835 [Mycena filopes]
MANLPIPAPAAPSVAPAAAGAGHVAGVTHQANSAVAAMTAAVNTLTATTATLLTTGSLTDHVFIFLQLRPRSPTSSPPRTAVQQAHANVINAFALLGPLLAPPTGFTSAPPQYQAQPQQSHQHQGHATTGPWIAGVTFSVVPTAPLTAVPDSGERWFAITRGRYVGLTTNSAVSLAAVTGVSTALSGRHASQQQALNHFNAALQNGVVAVI